MAEESHQKRIDDFQGWDDYVRVAFWLTGIVVAGIMAYTTRFYINGDAIAYVEMGEALRTGEWERLANLTYSPGYPVLLGIAQAIFNTNPSNELQLLRFVNFGCFVLTMGAWELVMHFVRKERERSFLHGEIPLPLPLVSALCYSMFLVASLVFIRIRLLNPDMLVMAIVLIAVAVILWIRENPGGYLTYVILGIVTGLGYTIKSFFLPFSPIFFALAGMCSQSVKRAIPRVLVSVLVMLAVGAPLIASLSNRLGRLSYGELGEHVYATVISGKGTPKHPEVINPSPKVIRYEYDITCTRPSGFDICYWHEGLQPDFDMRAHLKIIPGTVFQIVTQTPWLLIIVVWFVALWAMGSVRFGPVRPPSVPLLLLLPAVFGIGFYCLIRMEPRYIAPYLFLGFVGLTSCLRVPGADPKVIRRITVVSGVLICFFLAILVHSLVDQTVRGLYSTGGKPSFKRTFEEHVALKDFLLHKGVKPGDHAALVGSPPVYWGRMAGLRIAAEVPQAQEFLKGSSESRRQAVESLTRSGITVVVAKGSPFRNLEQEGWRPVPGTRDYFVLFLPGHYLSEIRCRIHCDGVI